MSPLLEIKNIETFYRLIYALRGVSLTVEQGTITTVLGNNGAGKSTVLKTLMARILKRLLEWVYPMCRRDERSLKS